ncbi:ESX secretion-associated protein EspG [Nocardia sp. NPDC019395]|uniref:ESX secretion-associated protein EspG n=1 Tax=Nocardia sp. NPDC019395 TaxID=3154686 RepID=UPI0033FED978
MNRSWVFTDIEFVAAWEAMKEKDLPAPFVYTSATERYDDHQLEKIEAWERVRSRWGREVEEILACVIEPDIRIVVRGFDGSDAQNSQRSIRLLAARKRDSGCLIVQKPGKTLWHAEGFTVTEHEVVGLGDAVVAALPQAARGRNADFVLVSGERSDPTDRSRGRSSVLDRGGDDPAARARSFGDAPVDLSGTIAIAQGYSRFGPRGIRRRSIGWRDIAGDGRYAIVPGNPARVVPVDRKRLVGLVNRQIAEIVRAIKDERANVPS